MIRVLFLRRQKLGGIATYTEILRHALKAEGIDVVIDDAEEWIPNETGWKTDRKVSKLLTDAAKGFDIVHAFGYRSAWACSEAFYLKKAWLYTAYDMPKTTVSALIDRLNAARMGICVSRAVKRALDSAETLNLEIVVPGSYVPELTLGRDEAREKLGLELDSPLVLAMGPFGSDRGFKALWSMSDQLKYEMPSVNVVALGPIGTEETGRNVTIVDDSFDKWEWLSAADIVLVPYERAGFSMVAAEAMRMGKVVVARRAGGLSEMGTENVNLELFDHDDDLLYTMLQILNSPIHQETIGSSAAIRAEDWFDLERCAREHAQIYRELVNR